MTKIWTEQGFLQDDPWVFAKEDADPVPKERVILTLADFLDLAANSNEKALGVSLDARDDVAALVPFLDQLVLVAVHFRSFSDGRGYSSASLLRERYGFKGDIRAFGDVLIDQIALMIRCGFSSFEVSHQPTLKRLEEGRLSAVLHHYQPAVKDAGKDENYNLGRRWRRVSLA